MFKIYDGRTHFWQWDTDCKLVVEDSSIQQVHFCNRLSECSLVCLTYKENEQLLVNVPNILFQSDRDIHVYAYNGFTKYEECFKIFARCKPSDYVYTETEVATWEQLDKRITDLEKGGVSEEALAGAIADYFVAHPIEDELTDYAKKTDVATAVSDKVTNEQLSNAIADFITESEVDNKISAIGTFNFDARSSYLNSEIMVIVHSEDFAKHLKYKVDKDLDNSLELASDLTYKDNDLVEEGQVSIFKKILIAILSKIVYFVDYLL